jgi:hypothetical protein
VKLRDRGYFQNSRSSGCFSLRQIAVPCYDINGWFDDATLRPPFFLKGAAAFSLALPSWWATTLAPFNSTLKVPWVEPPEILERNHG